MITITEIAANKILEIAAEEGLEGNHLRVKILGGGCGGFQYDLQFEDGEPLPMDEVFEDKGVKIVSDPLSYQYLNGSEITFLDGLYESGFKFVNPNISSSCGCGSSFSV